MEARRVRNYEGIGGQDATRVRRAVEGIEEGKMDKRREMNLARQHSMMERFMGTEREGTFWSSLSFGEILGYVPGTRPPATSKKSMIITHQ